MAVETERGVILTRRDELESLVRDQLAGVDVVAELLEERRVMARREDGE